MTTGEKIAAARKRAGLTQTQLAVLISVNQQAISRWESDRIDPTASSLRKLADAIGCKVDELC